MDTDQHPPQPGTSEGNDRGLDESMLAANPVDQFSAWLADAAAAGLPEPNAMVLSTVSAAGHPRSRSVLLKEHSRAGFVFYTNHSSAKAREMAANRYVSALFPWYALRRQVIVHGRVTVMSQDDSEPYFHSRPRGSQIAAWASRQSSVIASRAEIEDAYARLARRWPESTTVPMPDFWGGYRIVPESIEFWQGRVNRMHDRLRYRRDGERWLVERLSP